MTAAWLRSAVLGAAGIVLVSCGGPDATVREGSAVPESRSSAAAPSSAPAGGDPVSADDLLPEADPEPSGPRGVITEVDLGRLFELRDDDKALLIDVRPASFYARRHIPGAISLPKKAYATEFPGKRPELDAAVKAGKILVLYCADEDCPDGYAVAKLLAEEGYSSSLYKGGWREWKQAGLEEPADQ